MTKSLRDLDFKVAGAHVALVSKTLNGGPANQWDVLITKGMKDVNEELIEKAAQIRVEMSFSDFLKKWYGMWESDAEALSTLLGYEQKEGEEDEIETYQDYIASKLEGITLLKGFDLSGDVEKALSDLGAEQVLSVLKTQEALEPLMATIEKSKGETMTVETIEKSQHELLLKAAVDAAVADIQVTLTKAQEDLSTAQEDLVKALAQVDALTAEKAAAKVAARKESLVKAVGDAEAEDLLKSLEALDDAAFATVLKSLENKTAAIQDSLLTKELGAGGEGTIDEDQTRAILLQKWSNK